MQDLNQKIDEMLERYKKTYLQFQGTHDSITIIKLLFDIISDTIELIEELCKEQSGQEKRRVAIIIIKQTYKEIDPNIPGIPKIIEPYIENIILDVLVPSAIDYIVKQFNRLGLFKHKGVEK